MLIVTHRIPKVRLSIKLFSSSQLTSPQTIREALTYRLWVTALFLKVKEPFLVSKLYQW